MWFHNDSHPSGVTVFPIIKELYQINYIIFYQETEIFQNYVYLRLYFHSGNMICQSMRNITAEISTADRVARGIKWKYGVRNVRANSVRAPVNKHTVLLMFDWTDWRHSTLIIIKPYQNHRRGMRQVCSLLLTFFNIVTTVYLIVVGTVENKIEDFNYVNNHQI